MTVGIARSQLELFTNYHGDWKSRHVCSAELLRMHKEMDVLWQRPNCVNFAKISLNMQAGKRSKEKIVQKLATAWDPLLSFSRDGSNWGEKIAVHEKYKSAVEVISIPEGKLRMSMSLSMRKVGRVYTHTEREGEFALSTHHKPNFSTVHLIPNTQTHSSRKQSAAVSGKNNKLEHFWGKHETHQQTIFEMISKFLPLYEAFKIIVKYTRRECSSFGLSITYQASPMLTFFSLNILFARMPYKWEAMSKESNRARIVR